MSRLISAAACALIAATVLAGAEPTITGSVRVKPGERQPFLRAGRSMLEALGVAESLAPGRFVEAEFEVEDGFLVYAFEAVDSLGVRREVVVDAGNAKVLAVILDDENVELEEEPVEAGEDDSSSRPGPATVTLRSAVKAALSAFPGTAVVAELEQEDVGDVYEIRIADKSGRLHEVVVDGMTGEVLEHEVVDDDDED